MIKQIKCAVKMKLNCYSNVIHALVWLFQKSAGFQGFISCGIRRSNIFSNLDVLCFRTQLYKYLNINIVAFFFMYDLGYELTPHAAANFTRRTLAEYLRSSVSIYVEKYNYHGQRCHSWLVCDILCKGSGFDSLSIHIFFSWKFLSHPFLQQYCILFAILLYIDSPFSLQTPFQVNLLIAGYGDDGPELYHMDYLAAMSKVF